MKLIAVETLRKWLEEQRPVTILDVRTFADYQEWAIPGSIHQDIYEALKAHDTTSLDQASLPKQIPIVTVCGAGKTSQVAAHFLAEQGYEAFSLEGGMRAWSLAWNQAVVPLSNNQAQVIQLRRTGKGCLSYLIGVGHNAAVIDASLDPQIYLNLAKEHGWHIRHVLDTHIHADHLSRSRLLASRSGATLWLPEQRRVSFPFSPLHDGGALELEGSGMKILTTPGHTQESMCCLLDGLALFTGDTLFLESVGRPDLEATPEERERRADWLYHSLHRLLSLPGSTLVLPGHTSLPVAFDHRPLKASLAEVDEQIELLHLKRSSFLNHVSSRLPATPQTLSALCKPMKGAFSQRMM
jgi:glyoxylase-like metal-dependent hydrolase (beta-lactamase superfamily II)